MLPVLLGLFRVSATVRGSDPWKLEHDTCSMFGPLTEVSTLQPLVRPQTRWT